MSHDTRIRGTGTYLWKVLLREHGSSRETPARHSMIVRTGMPNESHARGVAQREMDAEGMRKYYPAEVESKGRY